MVKVSKKIILFAVLGVILSAGALAAWMLYAETNITGYVTSDGQAIMTFQWRNQDMGTIDTTTKGMIVNKTNYINNNNGLLELILDFEMEVIDVNDTCNNTGDLTASIFINNEEYFDGSNLNLTNGNHTVQTFIEAVPHSCDQNFTVSIALTEI